MQVINNTSSSLIFPDIPYLYKLSPIILQAHATREINMEEMYPYLPYLVNVLISGELTLIYSQEDYDWLGIRATAYNVESIEGDQPVKETSSVIFDNIKLTGLLYFNTEVDNGSSTDTYLIDWTVGNRQKITLTANCTYTFVNPLGPCPLTLKIVQGGIGNYTIIWPISVKWVNNTAHVLLTAVGATDILSFYFDGTTYWGMGASFV